MLDPDGIVQTWNPGAERLLERAQAEGSVQHSGWRVKKARFWANVVTTALYEDDGSLAGFTLRYQ